MKSAWTLSAVFLLILLSLPVWFVMRPSLADGPGDASRSSGQEHNPPGNPYLADSTWPMSHAGPYNQASTSAPGPRQAPEACPSFLPGEPVAITLAVSSAYADGSRVAWGTTLQHVFKMDWSSDQMRHLSKIARPIDRQDALSSAYAVLDRDGTYFTPHDAAIEAYGDSEAGEPLSPITLKHTYEIPSQLHAEQDLHIAGISLTYDGRIVFVTSTGLLGSLSRQLNDATYLQLDVGDESITNSVAVDETGGIFVVSSAHAYRVNWVPDGDSRLQLAWSCPYSSDKVRRLGRLGTGSGTTPSLVGTRHQDQFVAICDGQKLMHMVLFWRAEIPDDWEGLPGKDRRIAAEVPVRFGDPNAEESTTEQSITVSGYELVTVSNLYGELGPMMKRLYRRYRADVHDATIHQSNRRNIAPYGVEKFTWDPDSRELVSTWANSTASCPNGIPSMSAATGLLYFMGQRESNWTLEALDWDTGEPVFHQALSRSNNNNSFYAGMEIGPDGMVFTGTYGGVLRFAREHNRGSLVTVP